MKKKEKSDVNMQKKKEGGGDKEKAGKGRLSLFIVSGVLAALLLAYGGTAVFYQTHFLPGTSINGFDCGNLDAMSSAALLEQEKQNYTLKVTGRDWQTGTPAEKKEEVLLGTVAAAEIGLISVSMLQSVQEILTVQNPLLWPAAFVGGEKKHDLSVGHAFEEELLEKLVKTWDAFQPENMTVPEDAYIAEYNGTDYEIVPDTEGTELMTEKALEDIKEAVLEGAREMSLEDTNAYKKALVTAEDEGLQETCSTMNKWVHAEITYDWNGNEVVVNGEQIQRWISVENGEPVLNEEAVAEFVADNAKEYDTYGKKRRFTTSMGVELTLPSGAFGWKTDRKEETAQLLQLIEQGSIADREPVYTVRGGAKGSDDIGNSYVEIDLSNQHLYLYENSELKLESDFVSGDMSRAGRMTPPGVFGLTYKTRNAVLRGEDYATPVSYWMPFNGNIGMHDATWRKSFGGDIYLTNGSHGCINLPFGKAKEIYGYISDGFPVICYYY